MEFRRVLRHLFSTQRGARRIAGADVIKRLQAVIADGESRHRGEVRLIVESALPLRKVARGMSPRHRAMDLFGVYRVWDTENNNGVLLYINIADRRVEIIADRAAARAVDDGTWRAIAERLTQSFAAGTFEMGMSAALDAMNAVLTQAFPAEGAAPLRELDDAPIVR
jgi:uncharacterized membrane protein